jgi:uncharacterized protein YbbK (DUF523 family)/uncharacterized protein YbgA (DUF1722 family)
MMNEKPIICVSRCLGFEACRYNGAVINDNLVSKLKNHVDFIPVCPEVDIGLPIPRESLRLVKGGPAVTLIQPKTGLDVTEKMSEYTSSFFQASATYDGFILKSRSPSCGVKDVKIYSSTEKGASSEKGVGLFAAVVLERFPGAVIEDEGRLSNYSIREHFLTKLFTFHHFRLVKDRKSPEELLRFHSTNKLLFMAYNQKELKTLDKLLGNADNSLLERLLMDYEEHLKLVFARNARYTSNITVLQHAMKLFSDKITESENNFILDSLEKYKNGKLPLSAPVYVIKSYAVRFDLQELLNQSFFSPYPEELVELRDSGKGVN